jgi:phosphoglycerate dehydrogenase-like enzyme
MLITPHVARRGPTERGTEAFFDNCCRFRDGRSLPNVVDQAG